LLISQYGATEEEEKDDKEESGGGERGAKKRKKKISTRGGMDYRVDGWGGRKGLENDIS